LILNLDERYKVTTDKAKMNFQLEQLIDVKDKETGEVVRQECKVIGYHGGHLNHAILQYVKQLKLTSDEEYDIHKLLDKLNEIKEHIDRVVRRENITFELRKEEQSE
jgi:hypothetical protein